MNLLGNIFGFIVSLAVALGGLVCVAWFAGSLLVYYLLGRPMWEVAIVDMAASGVFIWFCVLVGGGRPSPRQRSAFIDRLKSINATQLGDESLPWRLFTYFTIVVSFMVPAFLILMIPMAMLAVTWVLWDAWAGGSEWMRSPGAMVAVIFSCLALACVAIWVVSWYFSPDESETKKKSVEEKRRRTARSGTKKPARKAKRLR